ncbi:MAG: hypothetical protein HY617_02230 [Candidatus Sungbacteria bacterium]|nr:hypothetical protein [Candidatus Sungbacteria bacterium]
MGCLTRRSVLLCTLAIPLTSIPAEALISKNFLLTPARTVHNTSIQLPRQEEGMFNFLRGGSWFNRMQNIALHPGDELTYRFFDQNGKYCHVTFSYVRSRLGFLIPQLRKEDGSLATLQFANLLSPTPLLRFADAQGAPITRANRTLEFPFDLDIRNFMEAGIAITFAALAIWIGAHVAKVILAILAVLAFYAMIIGILMVGTAAVLYIGTRLFPHIKGLDLEKLKKSFEEKKQSLEQYLRNLIAQHKT